MSAYIARRILLMIPTCSGSCFVSFVVVQFAPGGRSSACIAQLSAPIPVARSRIRAAVISAAAAGRGALVRRRQFEISRRAGLDPDFIKKLEMQFGFDKPAPERFALMLWNFARFDFGKSYFRDVSVLQLIKEKLPVSIRSASG
jgi:microcin C transport system permease protein